ncbi:MAG: rhamnan synthesis F family protein, partial [Lapillicoccus sp.]
MEPTDHPTDHPTDLEDSVRRVLFYLFHDRDGIVDEYVPYKLRALRPFVDHVFVVSNSDLTPEGRAALDEVADTVLVRENVGWDVGAFTAAMAQFGEARLAEYDELILMNSTFFAPVYPFAEVFERMAAEPVDFWGISSHPEVDPNPFENTTGILERHLQTHWVTVRRRMFTSLEWRDFWATMPPLVTYDDVVLSYEARFTAYFEHAGFRWVAAWPEEDYPTGHAIFESAPLLLADRCPIVKRRQFFHEPMFLERNAIIGRRVLQELERTNYPLELVWRNVARVAEPRVLYTNFSLLEMLPDTDLETDGGAQGGPRVLGLAHVSDPRSMEPLLAALRRLPRESHLVVTTPTRHADEVTRALATGSADDGPGMRVDVRPVPDDRGGHLAALLVEGRDLLEGGGYDLVCHVHTVRPADDESNAAHLLEDHNLDNVLATTGYVR